MLGVSQYNKMYMKIEFSSQRRELLLFFLEQQHGRRDVTCKPAIDYLGFPHSLFHSEKRNVRPW